MTSKDLYRSGWLWLIVPLLFLCWAWVSCWPHVLDDAYISMQYARNWVSGHGLVFNPGERVEGFSNPLWVLMLSVGGGVGIPWVLWGKCLGVCCLLSTIVVLVWGLGQLGAGAGSWVVQRERSNQKKSGKKQKKKQTSKPVWVVVSVEDESVLGRWGARFGASLIAIFCVVVHPGTGYYSVAGLETSLFALLVSLGVFWHLVDLHRHGVPTQTRCVWPLAAAAIARPEGPLFLVLVLLHRWWLGLRADEHKRSERWAFREGRASLLAVSVPGMWLLFRVLYYRSMWPNTYYAKPMGWFSFSKAGLEYLRTFFVYHVSSGWTGAGGWVSLSRGLAWVFGLSLVVLTVLALWRSSLRRVAWSLVFLCGVYLSFVVYAGGDWMRHHRLVQSILPLLYVIPALGWFALSRRGRWVLLGLFLLSWGGQAKHAHAFWTSLRLGSFVDHAHISKNNARMGRWMARHLEKDAAVVSDEIGALAFYSKLRVVDLLGLVDRRIARLLFEHRFNPYNSPRGTPLQKKVQGLIASEILRRRPGYVLIDYYGALEGSKPYKAYRINRLPMNELFQAIRPHYVYVRSFKMMRFPPKSFLLFRLQKPTTH